MKTSFGISIILTFKDDRQKGGVLSLKRQILYKNLSPPCIPISLTEK